MRLQSVSVKLWLVMVTLVLLVLGSIGFALNYLFTGLYINQNITSLEQQAKDIAKEVADVTTIDQLVQRLSNIRYTQGVTAFVSDNQGNILAVSGVSMGMGRGMGMTMHAIPLNESEFAQALAGKTIKKTIMLNGTGSAVMVANRLTLASGSFTGVIILSGSLAPVTESINSFRHLLYYVVGIALLLATLFALWLSRTLTIPLVAMNRVARRMSQGEFSDRIKVTSGDEIGMLGNSLNTLAEKLDQHIELLSREKKQLDGVLASMGDAVVTLNDRGELVQANQPATDLWNDEEERKGLTLHWLRQALQTVISRGEPVDEDMELGTQILHVHMEPLKQVEGQGGGVAVMRDVTAEHKQEKLRRELMASVSHELRTPVHLVQGQLEALVDGLVPAAQQQRFLDSALLEVQRLGRLVGELQEISRLDNGFPLTRERLDLKKLVEMVTEKYYPRTQEAGIRLTLKAEPMTVYGDSDRITQVLVNLLDNSLRYTPAGGEVSVKVFPEQNDAVIVVADTGKGISPEHLQNIWESFYRVEPTGKEHMGLGLAIVKRIVEAHQGQVSVSSELGKGTKFTLRMPTGL